MKFLSFLFLLLITSLVSIAQVPSIQWQKTLGGSLNDFGNSVAITPDGGYVVAGIARSNDGDVSGSHGINDLFITKLSSAGVVSWKKTYGSSGDDGAYSIINTIDSSFVVVGYAGANSGDVSGYHGSIDAWVIKISATGTILWQKSLGGSGLDIVYSIAQTIDSGYILAGITNSNDGDVTGNHGLYDSWVVKLNASGVIQWQKNLGGTLNERAVSVRQTTDTCYVITGNTESNDGDVSGNHGNSDCWVVKLSATGSILWQKCYGGIGSEDARSIIQTNDGGYIFGGNSAMASGDVTVNNGGSDYWLVKISNTGVLQWQKSMGGTANEILSSIVQMPDSSYTVSGITVSNDGDVSGNHGSFDLWLVKVDKIGSIKWQRTLGGSQSDDSYLMGTDIHKCNDGGYIICGSSSSNDGDVSGNHGLFDYWAVRLDCGFKVGEITGNHSVCLDGSVTLSDTTSGGVWSVSNTNVTISGGVVTAVTAGTVMVTYTVSNGCGAATVTFPITVISCPLTTNNAINSGQIIIAPNPASKFITITGINEGRVQIYNTIGQLMEETHNIDFISIAEFPQGVYFVKLFNDYGVVVGQQKIVKQ